MHTIEWKSLLMIKIIHQCSHNSFRPLKQVDLHWGHYAKTFTVIVSNQIERQLRAKLRQFFRKLKLLGTRSFEKIIEPVHISYVFLMAGIRLEATRKLPGTKPQPPYGDRLLVSERSGELVDFLYNHFQRRTRTRFANPSYRRASWIEGAQ